MSGHLPESWYGLRQTGVMMQAFPHTTDTLGADLRALGLTAGDTVLVHSSMRAVGFVAGGVQAVVQAVLDVLGPAGTLMVPTHTSANSDPAGWSNPPVPAAWWPVIRKQSPGFDPARTPSRRMGAFAEVVRGWPGTVRSSHPHVSFAALGARAEAVVGSHPLEDGLGDGSPLGALYRENGKVLLLGCGHGNNTSLHLGECRQPRPAMAEYGAAVRDPSGGSRWVTWVAPDADAADFPGLGAAYDRNGPVRIGPVGNAEARLMPQRGVVDFATMWLSQHRS
jgi:aminoglycoside 3-N-acetyltransferase